MNETLEAMARAIFKDWFVDFGPTRAKAEGREPYLAPEIWNLFPATLDDDDKPEGWKDESLASRLATLFKRLRTSRVERPGPQGQFPGHQDGRNLAGVDNLTNQLGVTGLRVREDGNFRLSVR